MNREHAHNLLKDVHETLEHTRLTHFLIDGTLLGAVRDKDFIEHDSDIDLGVYANEWTYDTAERVIRELADKGITMHHVYGKNINTEYELTFKRDDIKIDLFFYRHTGDTMQHCAFNNGWRNGDSDVIRYAYPAFLIEELGTIDFRGMRLPAPKNAEQVLACKYGPEWHIPVKKWDWRTSPCNVVS